VWNSCEIVGELVELFFGFGVGIFVDGAHADVIHATRGQQKAGVGNDVNRVQRAAKMPADGRGIRQGRFGRGGEIGGEQNVLYRNCGDKFRRDFAIGDRDFWCFDVGLNECHNVPPTPVVRITLGRWGGDTTAVTCFCDLNHIFGNRR
jgi:hypothetical protein